MPVERNIVRIIRSVPRFLQINERERKFFNFVRKFFHCLLVQAGTSCVSVFKCAVNLMPSRGEFSTDEQVGGSVGQRVEHSIIGGADRAAQVGLRGCCGSSSVKLRAVVIKSRAFKSQVTSISDGKIIFTGNRSCEYCLSACGERLISSASSLELYVNAQNNSMLIQEGKLASQGIADSPE